MIPRVLVDTGPMVAVFSKRDAFHEICVAQLREMAPPLITTWPVVTEAVWLLREYPPGIERRGRGVFEFSIPPLETKYSSFLSGRHFGSQPPSVETSDRGPASGKVVT